MTKIGLAYAISIIKCFFVFFLISLRKYFYFPLLILIIDILQPYCKNFRKFEQVELVKNLPLSTYPVVFFLFVFLHNL